MLTADASEDIQVFAHTLEGRPEAEWQRLEDHLIAVGEMAALFSADFAAESWGGLAGLWHDMGKYSESFQNYLRRTVSPDPHVADGGRTDHSTAGAQHAVSEFGILGHLLAYVIAGHHSGLLDSRGTGACLEARLRKTVDKWSRAPHSLLDRSVPEFPSFVRDAFARKDAFTIAFFTRMIFSCLVDADFLDTEQFMSPDRAAERPKWPDDILTQMEASLEAYVSGLGGDKTFVDQERDKVHLACLDAADEPPGLFSLTVPTGGGKTLSSLAFALKHARLHGLRRVIYVAPFTTIIEQNAAEFRNAIAAMEWRDFTPVLEHHSTLDVGKETTASRLAAENWDAPLIVTTSVQFYESMFANRTSRCRKLHRLSKAVIILDEAQTVPVDYLAPCLRVLRELTESYGSTVILCTATQPAVEHRDDFSIGLKRVREIIPDPPRLYRSLKRVEVEDLGRITDQALVERLLDHERVLCIVNTRKHARALFEGIGQSGENFHLSALMCPEHRSESLTRIRNMLTGTGSCRVVSTQLIEAGVDIDFPIVYRSLAGVDSIAQAAGRCNRNGRLDRGVTYVFRSEHDALERFFADTSNCASQVLPLYDDPLSLEAVEHYFRLYYWDQSSRCDARKIIAEFQLDQNPKLPFLFGFKTVADRFRIIEDSGLPVIVPWGDEGKKFCAALRCSFPGPSRQLLRSLQRYTVQVPRRTWQDHCNRTLEMIHERYPLLVSLESHYSEDTGLDLERTSQPLVI